MTIKKSSVSNNILLSICVPTYNREALLKKMLDSIDLISDFYILKFNNQNTQYKIIYNGSPKSFFNEMNNKNFILSM